MTAARDVKDARSVRECGTDAAFHRACRVVGSRQERYRCAHAGERRSDVIVAREIGINGAGDCRVDKRLRFRCDRRTTGPRPYAEYASVPPGAGNVPCVSVASAALDACVAASAKASAMKPVRTIECTPLDYRLAVTNLSESLLPKRQSWLSCVLATERYPCCSESMSMTKR